VQTANYKLTNSFHRFSKVLFARLEEKRREEFEKMKAQMKEIDDIETKRLWKFIFLYNIKSLLVEELKNCNKRRF